MSHSLYADAGLVSLYEAELARGASPVVLKEDEGRGEQSDAFLAAEIREDNAIAQEQFLKHCESLIDAYFIATRELAIAFGDEDAEPGHVSGEQSATLNEIQISTAQTASHDTWFKAMLGKLDAAFNQYCSTLAGTVDSRQLAYKRLRYELFRSYRDAPIMAKQLHLSLSTD